MKFNQTVIAMFVVAGIMTGCGGNDIIGPENAHNYKNNDIVVHMMKDKTRIFFKKGKYDVKESPDGRVLSGSGNTISDSSNGLGQVFVGDIKLTDIEKIEIVSGVYSENNLHDVGMYIALAAIVLYFVMGPVLVGPSH